MHRFALLCCLLATCTVIDIEGNAITASHIEDHTGMVKVPASPPASSLSQ
ncbi:MULTISPECIES: hypothetical protein [Paraburkholderia]|nr:MULTISPECIES: hypothetical protein [Paraburkholderia]